MDALLSFFPLVYRQNRHRNVKNKPIFFLVTAAQADLTVTGTSLCSQINISPRNSRTCHKYPHKYPHKYLCKYPRKHLHKHLHKHLSPICRFPRRGSHKEPHHSCARGIFGISGIQVAWRRLKFKKKKKKRPRESTVLQIIPDSECGNRPRSSSRPGSGGFGKYREFLCTCTG